MESRLLILLAMLYFSLAQIQTGMKGNWVDCTAKYTQLIIGSKNPRVKTETQRWCFIPENRAISQQNQTVPNVTQNMTTMIRMLEDDATNELQFAFSNSEDFPSSEQQNLDLQLEQVKISVVQQYQDFQLQSTNLLESQKREYIQNLENLDQISQEESQDPNTQLEVQEAQISDEDFQLVSGINQFGYSNLFSYCMRYYNVTVQNYNKAKQERKEAERIKRKAEEKEKQAKVLLKYANQTLKLSEKIAYDTINNALNQYENITRNATAKANLILQKARKKADQIIQKALEQARKINETFENCALEKNTTQQQINQTGQTNQTQPGQTNQTQPGQTTNQTITNQTQNQNTTNTNQTTPQLNQTELTQTNQTQPGQTNQTQPGQTNQTQPGQTNQTQPGQTNQTQPEQTNLDIIPDETHFHYHYQIKKHEHRFQQSNLRIQDIINLRPARNILVGILKDFNKVNKPESNFKFDHCKPVCSSYKEVYHYHYHWHHVNHHYAFQVMNRTVVMQPIQLSTQMMKQLDNFDMQQFSQEQREAQQAQQNFKTQEEIKTFLFSWKPALKEQNGSVTNITIPVKQLDGSFQKFDIPLTFSQAEFPGKNINHYVKIYAEFNHTFYIRANQTATHRNTQERAFKLQYQNFTKDSANVVVHYHVHDHLYYNYHKIIAVRDQVITENLFINKSTSETRQQSSYPTVMPGFQQDQILLNTYYVPGDMNTSKHVENQNKHFHYSFSTKVNLISADAFGWAQGQIQNSTVSATLQDQKNTEEFFDVFNYSANMTENQTHYHYEYTVCLCNITVYLKNLDQKPQIAAFQTDDDLVYYNYTTQLEQSSGFSFYLSIAVILVILAIVTLKLLQRNKNKLENRSVYHHLLQMNSKE